MTLKHLLVGVGAALALSALSAPVQAAPLGVARDGLKAATDENTVVQDVVWVRRCWWHGGHRHCRRVWSDRPHYYGSYPYDDSYYYGYGPSFGFSFGGGHRHHGHGGHGHHGHGGHRHR